MSTEPARWRRCSACKNDIALGAIHWVCSVSTCNRKRTGLVFCSVDCWEIHLPTERHREAWAVEARAPTKPETTDAPTSKQTKSSASGGASAKPAASRAPAPAAPAAVGAGASSDDVLVVASRLKAYVKSVSGFNTSDRVLPVLSDALRAICEEAIENARRAERLTVLDRDVPRAERTTDATGRPALIRRKADR